MHCVWSTPINIRIIKIFRKIQKIIIRPMCLIRPIFRVVSNLLDFISLWPESRISGNKLSINHAQQWSMRESLALRAIRGWNWRTDQGSNSWIMLSNLMTANSRALKPAIQANASTKNTIRLFQPPRLASAERMSAELGPPSTAARGGVPEVASVVVPPDVAPCSRLVPRLTISDIFCDELWDFLSKSVVRLYLAFFVC